MCIVIIYCPGCDVIDFEINHIFQLSYQDVFLCSQKSQDIYESISKMKRAFNMKKKSIFKNF